MQMFSGIMYQTLVCQEYRKTLYLAGSFIWRYWRYKQKILVPVWSKIIFEWYSMFMVLKWANINGKHMLPTGCIIYFSKSSPYDNKQ